LWEEVFEGFRENGESVWNDEGGEACRIFCRYEGDEKWKCDCF